MLPGVSHAFLQAAFAQPATDKHEQLRRQLLRYCVQHPDAKDTIEGILAWWFPRGSARWSAAEVKTTLDELIRDGLLTGRSVRQSEVIYGVRKEKLSEIEKLLGGFTAEGDT